MKTVSGTIVSSKHVNLSKAANILSKFVKSDNGASQAVSAYLRRASEAFDEHVYFKKHHKFKKNRSKEEASAISDKTHRDIEENEGTVMENGGGTNREFDQDPVEVDENRARKVEGKLRKKDKKKKKTEDPESGKNDTIEAGSENGIEAVKEKDEETKKKKNKRKNAEVDRVENGLLIGRKFSPDSQQYRCPDETSHINSAKLHNSSCSCRGYINLVNNINTLIGTCRFDAFCP